MEKLYEISNNWASGSVIICLVPVLGIRYNMIEVKGKTKELLGFADVNYDL